MQRFRPAGISNWPVTESRCTSVQKLESRVLVPTNVGGRSAKINEHFTTRTTGCHQAVAMPAYRTFALCSARSFRKAWLQPCRIELGLISGFQRCVRTQSLRYVFSIVPSTYVFEKAYLSG